MTGAADKLAKADAQQRRAGAPEASVWVAASAGTGKTKVLTDRVLGLMLAGSPPARVLCLTFTKAAAAEMANRLAGRLAAWATMAEAALADELEGLTGEAPSAATLAEARRLFARVLDVPGGMKIQTIHAFCQALLRRFPLEAGVAPHFRVLDERSAAEMLRDAREEVLAGAEAGSDGLGAALAAVTAHADEQRFAELMAELLRERGRLVRLLRRAGSFEALAERVYATVGVERGESPESVRRAACEEAAVERLNLELAAQALEQGTEAERDKAACLRAWLAAAPAERAARFDAYASIFLTQTGEVRKTLLTKAAAEVPGALAVMEGEAERLAAVRRRMNAAAVARATSGLLELGAAILEAYERHKRLRALLDYDDLILTARDLLDRPGVAPWVLFKLDGGLDHVLIDEAQDTNPEQWQVVRALTEEFFAGEGAAEDAGRGPRTVFAVGDAKQSIYSFQRADPDEFERMRAHFRARAEAAGRGWDSVELDVSFRSVAPVLQAVDAVFARAEAQDGVLFEEAELHHDPVRVGQAGRVELWPPADPPEAPAAEPWQPPTMRTGSKPPRLRLAKLVAEKIRRWTQDGDPEGWLEARGRQMRPGDILVLVRRRNEFVEELVCELKDGGVPVAGVDRMVLAEQLAVMDLVALGRFLLLPEDDLTLAAVLKGPLVGLSEERLFELAWRRPGGLWGELRRRRGDNGDFAEAEARLSEWLARVDFVPPYELYAELLGAGGGREAILARLGPEAADPLDEFMALALAYEREHVPSLEGFLHWLEAGAQEVRRDMEHGAGKVRVMTVHGAKGLQAPVVILPDTLQVPTQRDSLLWLEDRAATLWPPHRDYHEEQCAAARELQRAAVMREYRRLLYVAMTRAEDRLYVCGWNTRNKAPEECWYRLVERALAGRGEEVAFDFSAELGADGWAGAGRRLAAAQTAPPSEKEAAAAEAPAPGRLPEWAERAPAAEPAPPRPLAPSRPAAEPPPRSPLAEDDRAAARRGRLVHRLLETLPELPARKRAAAGRRLLAQPIHGLDAAEIEAILAETLAVIEHPDFAHLFGPASRAEVPVVGLIEGADGPEAVSGQIDRLVVGAEAVAIVDYKTNRPPPESEAEVPEAYRRQMAAYRRLVAGLYPGRRVDCLLLWTDGPRLMHLRDV